jgi:hypothetical protein
MAMDHRFFGSRTGDSNYKFDGSGDCGMVDPGLTPPYETGKVGNRTLEVPTITKLVKDKGPRIDTTRLNPKDFQNVNGAWEWNEAKQTYVSVPMDMVEPPRLGLLVEEEDNIPCQEEKGHYTFPNHKAGPVTTAVFDKEDNHTEPDQDARPSLTEFERSLKNMLNKYSMENDSNTPDFILAEYMHACLMSFNIATRAREHWYGRRVF